MSKVKYNIEEIREIVNKLGYEFVSAKSDGDHWNLIIIDKIGYYYTPQLSNLLLGKKPQMISSCNKYSLQNLKLWMIENNLEYKLLSKQYINSNSKLLLQDNDGYLYLSNWNHLKQSHFPRMVDKNNPYSIFNIKLWVKKNYKDYKLISKLYDGVNKKLEWECKKCNTPFFRSWQEAQRGQFCPFCKCLAYTYPELCKEWDIKRNKNISIYDVSYGCETNYWWKCSTCGYNWLASPNNRTYMKSGCPECNKSKGEKECKRVFVDRGFVEITQNDYYNLLDLYKDNYIYFIPQKTFDGLLGVGGGLLSYDFYLPKYNLLIEYQGEFHDGTAYQQTKEDFEKQLEHDRRKREYAENNNIKLLEIWYWDFDNIESILKLIGGRIVYEY